VTGETRRRRRGPTLAGQIGQAGARALTSTLGGPERTRVILVLASILALSSADTSTVGASATRLRSSLGISNTQVGLLVAVTSLVAALFSLPFGALADRVNRTKALGIVITLWGGAMIWSASVPNFGQLLLARVFLGAATAAAGPLVASLVGDWFRAFERGQIYGYILAGELFGAGIGFAVTGDISALSWRAAFAILAVPAFLLSWIVIKVKEPSRGGSAVLPGFAAPTTERRLDAGGLAAARGVAPDPTLVLTEDPQKMSLITATRYLLRIPTNVGLIVASACGYFFLAGLQTFGSEFTSKQYGIGTALANLLLLVVGVGAIAGVLAGGALGDFLLGRGYLNGRILVSAVGATLSVVAFTPALLARSATTAVPYFALAAFALSAQNPPLDAARFDIVVSQLWGRAEGVRTFLRTGAQASAPLLFGAASDYVFGGGRTGLQWSFIVMLIPLGASAFFLYRSLRTYPRDIANAKAGEEMRSSPLPNAADSAYR
jgi:predicted MFS family arabinose efflux permease